ncbi:hypothetical protein SACC_28670 [Saccharolobus caldissimus]|uniref:Uncharacterized protein n=1 Tax=Saccharolobus caldissimus TaxID=1702097 RepID=A0AAQ4CVL9_9CREN|nr:hypothetical protein SACC_28670 [Saccharolobus caldissimus]
MRVYLTKSFNFSKAYYVKVILSAEMEINIVLDVDVSKNSP